MYSSSNRIVNDVGTASPDPETGDRLITAGTRTIFSVRTNIHGLVKFKSLPQWFWRPLSTGREGVENGFDIRSPAHPEEWGIRR